MRIKNLQTLSFFVLIALLSAAPSFHKKLKRGKDVIQGEGENARWLYTGKTRDVYDPLDNAYMVTDTLNEMILREKEMDFSKYQILPVVSVWIDPEDLHDEGRGIFTNPLKKGRLWERASYISYYEKGEKKFSSFAGVRVHGGSSRRNEIKSFRFNFRKKYGESHFLTENLNTRSIIVRRESPYIFSNDFSYEAIRKAGGLAPKIQYAAVYLNGDFYQNLHIVEHQNSGQLSKKLQNKRIVYYKLKGNNKSRDRLLYESAIHKVKTLKGEKLVNYVKKEFDLDNLLPWYLMVTYLGMHDWVQGIWFKELDIENPKWKLIAWDFDTAFTNGYDPSKKSWEINGVDSLSKMYVASLQGNLFRAIYNTPELKEEMKERVENFCKMLNVTFLEKMIEYRELQKEFSNQSWIEESLSHYHEFFHKKKCLEI